MNDDRVGQGATSDVARFFVAGGTLSPGVPSYISRQADEDLYSGLMAGEFCYVLTSRQMGKSSLMVRTAARLRDAGSTVAMLDVTSVGQQVTPNQWYDGLAMGLGQSLDMEDELEDFWLDHERLSPVQRWIETIRAAVLPNIDGRLVIFVDEIDTVRSLPFPTDEFFAAIRACYNRRSQTPEFERLTFCLLGVSTPTDLIRNPQTTPFNIGRRIDLEDFTASDIATLAPGMAHLGESATRTLGRVLHWTGGHPYLTQRLCEAVAKDEAASGPADVDRLCDELYLSTRAREQDTNLAFARDRVLRGGDMEGLDRASVLTLYGQALRGRRAPADDANPVVSLLKIAGLVRVDGGNLRARNRIYESVFDKAWIRENMPDAELRRQRIAFAKGVVRTAVIATVVVGVVVAFLAYSIRQERRIQRQFARSQVERGMALLEAGDSSGLLQLVNAVDTVGARGEEGQAIASLWAGWEQEHAGGLAFVGGHDAGVTGVAYSPDGRRLVTTSYDRTVRMWDVATGALVGVSQEYGLTTRAVAFHPNGRLIAVGRSDRRVDVLAAEPKDGKLSHIVTLEIPRRGESTSTAVMGVDFGAGGALLAAGSGIGSVKLWDVTTWTPYGQTLEVPAQVYDVALSSDGATVVAACSDDSVRVWDTHTGLPLAPPISSDFAPYQAFALAPGSHLITTKTAPDLVRLWDIGLSQAVGPTFETAAPVQTTAFSPDGSLLAIGSVDGVVRIYDRATGEGRAVVPRHMGAVFEVTFSPDGASVASASMDGSVRVARLDLDEDDPPPLWDADALMAPPYAASFSRGGHRLLTAFRDGDAQVWDAGSGARVGVPLAHGEPAMVALAPDGRVAVTLSEGEGMKVWNADTGRLLGAAPMPEDVGDLDGLWFAPGGRRVDVWSPSGEHEVWDVTNGPRRVGSLRPGSRIYWTDFSPDGTRLAVGELAGVAWIWDIRASRRLGPTFQHDHTVMSVEFSHDGSLLATAARDQRVRLWNVDDGAQVGPPMRQSAVVRFMRFGPDDGILATAADDGVLRLWDMRTHQQVGAPRRHGTEQFAVTVGPEGRFIATHGASLRLWHTATGRLHPLPLRQPNAALVGGPEFSDDGRKLLATFDDARVRHWSMPEPPPTFREMQLRTWVDLVARLNDQGVLEPIPWEEWRRLRDELTALGSP